MKTGREIYEEIKELESKLNRVRGKKMVARIGMPEYQELKKERDQLYVEIEKLLDTVYIDPNTVSYIGTDSIVINKTEIEFDKEAFKKYMNNQYSRLSGENLKYTGGFVFINPKFAE